MARIAILTTPQGHFSIATAIEEALRDTHEVQLFTINDNVSSIYTMIYQFYPAIYGAPYQFSKKKSIVSVMKKFFCRKLILQVTKFIESSQPELIICTHNYFIPALEKLQKKNHIPIINVLADPRSIHPLQISEAAQTNLVFDKRTLQICQKLFPEARYTVIGWFVRKAFHEKPAATHIRRLQKVLKLNTTQQTVLITGGSEGTLTILKLIPALMQLKKPTNVIVLCGNNKNLLRSVKSFAHLFKAVANYSRIIPVGYTSSVADYLVVADVVVGKAGPNTIFEAVATKKPFIAITHITGQEDGNLDLIREYRLGFVEENAMEVVKLLQRVLSHPAHLAKLQQPIAQLAAQNQLAGKKLFDLIDGTLHC